MDAYGVVGNPINHSKSPKIHHLFAEQLGHQISYSKDRIHFGRFYKDNRTVFYQRR